MQIIETIMLWSVPGTNRCVHFGAQPKIFGSPKFIPQSHLPARAHSLIPDASSSPPFIGSVDEGPKKNHIWVYDVEYNFGFN